MIHHVICNMQRM